MFTVAVERSATPPTPQATSDMGAMIYGGVFNLLKIAKEASAPLPPLQAALGAVVASLEICEVSPSRFGTYIPSDHVRPFHINRNIVRITIPLEHLGSVLIRL